MGSARTISGALAPLVLLHHSGRGAPMQQALLAKCPLNHEAAPAAWSLQAPSPPPPLPGLEQPLSPASDDSSYLAMPLARPQHRRRQRAVATPLAASPVQSYGHGGQTHCAMRTAAAHGLRVRMMQSAGCCAAWCRSGHKVTATAFDIAGRQQDHRNHLRPHRAWSSPEQPPQKRPRQQAAHETSYQTQRRRWPFCCHAARPLVASELW